MGNDLQVIQFRELLPVTSVFSAPGVSPPSIWIAGENFSSALSIWVNETKCPEFAVFSQSRVLAQLPASMVVEDIVKVEVVSGRVTAIKKSHVDFSIGPFYKTSGIERVMQTFVKILLQSPGSDMHNPSAGGGVLQLIGSSMGNEGAIISASIARAIDHTARYLIEAQAKVRNLPPEDRLLSAKLEGIEVDMATLAVSVRVFIRNMAGNTATPSFSL